MKQVTAIFSAAAMAIAAVPAVSVAQVQAAQQNASSFELRTGDQRTIVDCNLMQSGRITAEFLYALDRGYHEIRPSFSPVTPQYMPPNNAQDALDRLRAHGLRDEHYAFIINECERRLSR